MFVSFVQLRHTLIMNTIEEEVFPTTKSLLLYMETQLQMAEMSY